MPPELPRDALLLGTGRAGALAFSRSAWRNQRRSVSAVQPILAEIDSIVSVLASHVDPLNRA